MFQQRNTKEMQTGTHQYNAKTNPTTITYHSRTTEQKLAEKEEVKLFCFLNVQDAYLTEKYQSHP